MNTAVCIFKTNDSFEAELLRSKLDANGIFCFLQSDNAGGAEPSLTFVQGISLIVHKDQEVTAKTILELM